MTLFQVSSSWKRHWFGLRLGLMIALIHTAGAFALLTFLMAHVYLTTTGETPTSNLKAMITGREEFPTAAAVEPDRDLIPQDQSPHTRR